MIRIWIRLLVASFTATGTHAVKNNDCELQALFPIDIAQSHSDVDHQSRFEVQRCSVNSGVQFRILGFKGSQKTANLIINDPNYWVDFVLFNQGTLIIQLGSAAHVSSVYILRFKNGQPKVVAKDSTSGGITCAREFDHRQDYLIIRVPQFSYPGNPPIADHVYRLPS